jgi:hypothetical protein
VDVDAGSYRAFINDGGDGEPVIGSTVLPRGVRFDSATFGKEEDNFITFSSRGFPMQGNTAVGGSIDLVGNLGTTRSVVLILSGHALIE